MDESRIVFQQPHVLLDIEGTTSSITFVKNVMFPYIRQNLEKFTEKEWNSVEFQSSVTLLKKQCEEDLANNFKDVIPITEDSNEKESLIKYVFWQMDQNRKTTALKTLEGCILKNAFSSGELKGHLYSDVKPALQNWKENGKRLHIYSSGSVAAQKLFFKHSVCGDLLHLFSNHFDTNIGSKIESDSYIKIAKTIGCAPKEIIFLTDSIKEAEAAFSAGLRVVISERPGNELIPDKYRMKYQFIGSFDQLLAKQ